MKHQNRTWQCFTSSALSHQKKKKKGSFFGDAQEGMINNTSGLYSTDCAALALISPWRENNPRQ